MRAGSTSGLVTVALLGIALAVGCSASGTEVVTDEATEPTEPTEPGPQLPASNDDDDDDAGKPAAKDAGKPGTKDGGKDGAVDAGPPPPVSGTACTVIDQVKKKTCGACGTQSTICLSPTGSVSTAKWSDYSPCDGELANGCVPGTVVTEACGSCGSVTKTCTQYCAFSATACTGQPTGACVPGSVDLSGAGCSADLFRQRPCSAACAYASFSLTCDAPPTTIEVGPTAGNVSSTIAILSSTQTLPRVSGTTCPTATFPVTVTSPYVYLRVHNPLAKSATVAIYNSLAPGGVAYKTALAAYDGVTSPTDEASRKLCLKAATYGTTALTGDAKFASLDGTKAITIAAGGTVSVYVAAYYAYDATKPTESTGKVKLVVQTISLQ